MAIDEENFRRLRAIIARKALVPEEDVLPWSDLFEDLDIDSLCLVEALVEIQEAFAIKIDPALPKSQVSTPEKILALISQS